uniref:Protein-serine/threonine phosphatase n=1 Tax=Panagrolaimus sp. JU765 TaxID=591449 RepID=A0AC34RS70_9BILA
MALVSVQRSPSPVFSDLDDEAKFDYDNIHHVEPPIHPRSISEFYFTVKGAAVILAHQDESNVLHRSSSEDKDLELHLQCMLRSVRQQDTLSRVVRLQSVSENLIRYLAVLENKNDVTGRSVALFGFDLDATSASVGLIVSITSATKVKLDGDGGICVQTFSDIYFFKPVSIQAMWSVFQYLNKEISTLDARNAISNYWPNNYKNLMTKDDVVRGLWHTSLVDDSMVGDLKAQARPESMTNTGKDEEAVIKRGLRQIMQSVDLDDVTSKDIREKLETSLGKPLLDYKTLIDQEMLVIMGQLDKPSKIFDYLYLGTEWNASNWEELKANKVNYILNVTKEVDNFYPNQFVYLKIWVSDEATTELLMHWQKTYEFIKNAKNNNSVVLVHCKKGISRSSSTVIAYIMKEYGESLESALNYVKEKRNCITPNSGFMEQLTTFDGMLQASSNRHSHIFNTKATSSESSSSTIEDEELIQSMRRTELVNMQIKRLSQQTISSKLISPIMRSPRSSSITSKLRVPFCYQNSSTVQEKKEINFRAMKFSNGTVRQHRDKFEKGSTRKTFPLSNNANKQKDSISDMDDDNRSVRSLVDVFEKCNGICLYGQDFDAQQRSNDSSLITSMT